METGVPAAHIERQFGSIHPRIRFTKRGHDPNLRPLDTITAAMLILLSIGSTTTSANHFFQAMVPAARRDHVAGKTVLSGASAAAIFR